MPGPPFLRGDDVALHVDEREDLDLLQTYRNDPAVRHGLTLARPRNRHQAEEAFERHSEDDSGVGLLICPREERDVGPGDPDDPDDRNSEADDRDSETEGEREYPDPVGQIVLSDIDEIHGTAELSCWVAPDERRQGYASEGTALLIEYAFGERRLHKVVARALVTNEASRTVFERLGFREEGVQRDQKYVDGEYVDVARYSLLAREWEGP